MKPVIDVRTDSATAEAVSAAMKLVVNYGYQRARQHMLEAGVQPAIAERMLLIRYDRRRGGGAFHAKEFGVFRNTGGES
jgi:hypothetical protein